jgi:macrolide-specific efflux system membrane fusion protein
MQRRIRLRPAWVIAGVVVVVVAAGGGAWAVATRSGGTDKTTYLTAKVVRTTVSETIQATGTAQASQNVALSFGSSSSGGGQNTDQSQTSTSGLSASSGAAKVTSVSVAVGDTVTKGEQLAKLDDTAQRQQLTLAQAQLVQAEAGTSTTQSSTPSRTTAKPSPTPKPSPKPSPKPTQSPMPTPSTSPAANTGSYVVEDVANDVAVQQAQQAVTDAENALAATTLKAPFDGVVTAVNLSAGVPPPSSDAIDVRSSTMTVQASVPEADVSHVTAGQAASVTFTALGSASTPATVVSKPVQASTATGTSSVVTFPISLSLSALPAGLLPGMSAAVNITITSHANVLAVPTSAVGGTDSAPTVQILGVDGTPASTPVEIGLTTSQLTEIVVGLQVGQTVVTGVVNPQQTTGTTGGNTRTGIGGAGGGFGGGGGRFTGGGGTGSGGTGGGGTGGGATSGR